MPKPGNQGMSRLKARALRAPWDEMAAASEPAAASWMNRKARYKFRPRFNPLMARVTRLIQVDPAPDGAPEMEVGISKTRTAPAKGSIQVKLKSRLSK